MPAIDRSLDAVAFVSEHFRDILRRRLSELAGLALITLALLGAIALATWSVQDPSLSHATQTPVHNLLGFPGAIFSDLAMQLLGLAAIMLLLPEMLLGWRLLSHRPLGDKWRGLLWILATFLAAGFRLDAAAHRLLAAADRLGRRVRRRAAARAGVDLRPPAARPGAARRRPAVRHRHRGDGRLRRRLRRQAAAERARRAMHEADDETEDDDGDRASAWLGMIAHALLSWKARAGRLFRRTPRTPLPRGHAGAAGPRQEPRFDAYGRVAAGG